ncbi:hypothetical protein D3C81_1465260 [compost metagenome]
MKLLGTDPDFGTETELESIGETGRCIMIDRSRIDLIQEAHSILFILSNDTLRMLGAVFGDVSQGLIEMRYYFDVKNIIVIFCSIVLLSSFLGPRHELPG